MILALCESSESQKMKHELTQIPFQPWITSCVKGEAQNEPHKRIERTEDSKLANVRHAALFWERA